MGTDDDYGGGGRGLFNMIWRLNNKKFKPIVVLTSKGKVCEKLDKLNIDYYFMEKHDKDDLKKYTSDILECLNFYQKNKIDLIHLNGSIGWKPAEIIAATILSIPIVSHFHVVIEHPTPYFKCSNMAIANSSFTAQHSVSLSVPKRVVYYPTDLERFEKGNDIRNDLGLEEQNIIISFLGQIKKIKGVEMFIQVAKSLSGKNLKFLIAGECRKSDDSYTFEELNELISFDKRIKYLGYREDVENIYATSDIIIMPSQWEEPFGLISIEAGAAGKPVIATKVGGIPEIISHGGNGFLVDKDDLDSMIKYTQMLINDPELRKRMGEKGREIVEKEFTDKPVRELENIYDELLNMK
jgi:glycosyltransferase involved in cell wall biosynthesis